MPRNDGIPRHLPRKSVSDFPTPDGEDPGHVVTHEGANPGGIYRRIGRDPRKQPEYLQWIAAQLMGQRCQAPWCTGDAEQIHHEPCGVDKTDESVTAICSSCHRDRHEGRTPEGYTMRQVQDAHEAAAGRNYRAYLRARGIV